MPRMMDGGIDTQRIGEALARPGMDPRTWISLAIVTRISVEKAGVICDITLLPDVVPESAVFAPNYGGGGYGEHAPLELDQMVIVCAPSGDPNHGLRIIGRVWDAGEPPPDDVIEHPTDHVVVVKAGASHRLRTTGAGVIHVMSEKTVELKSGPDAAVEKMLLAETYRRAEDTLLDALDLALTKLGALATLMNTSAPPLGGAPDQGATKAACTPAATAATDAHTALATFKAASASYLAKVGRVE